MMPRFAPELHVRKETVLKTSTYRAISIFELKTKSATHDQQVRLSEIYEVI
jgi:hypothetical protein